MFHVLRYIGAILLGGSRLCLGFVFGFRVDHLTVLCVYCMIIVHRKGLMPAPHTVRSSFGRSAKSRVWPIRHWGGEVHSTNLYGLILVLRSQLFERLR